MGGAEKILLAFVHGKNHPSARFRILQYRNYLLQHGWQTQIVSFWPEHRVKIETGIPARWKAHLLKLLRTLHVIIILWFHRKCDVVLVSRELAMHLHPFLTLKKPLIVDCDDAVYLGSERYNFEALCRRADIVVAGNTTLATMVKSWNAHVTVIPTVVDASLYRVKCDYENTPVRVGWMGSDYSVRETLMPFLPVLAKLQTSLKFDFVVVTQPAPPISQKELRWRFVEWSPAVENNIAELVDIGIMPLEDTLLQRSKCGVKLLQYMAAGIPTVATPLGVNAQIVTEEKTGLHANTVEERKTALTRLVKDAGLRARFGMAGRKSVIEEFSVARWGKAWVELLDFACGIQEVDHTHITHNKKGWVMPLTTSDSPLAHPDVKALHQYLSQLPAPFVIYNKSHSGSRLLARAMREQGMFMGSHLNDSEDSLPFIGLIYVIVENHYPDYQSLWRDHKAMGKIAQLTFKAVQEHLGNMI